MAKRGTPDGEAAILASFERVLKRMQAQVLRKLQAEGRKIHAEMAASYGNQRYANEAGNMTSIRGYGKEWGKYKEDKGLDLRRGHARLGVSKAVKSKQSFIPTTQGFKIDYKAGAAGVSVREKASERGARRRKWGKASGSAFGKGSRKARRARLRIFNVADYIGHFSDQKAPGLGTLSKAHRARVEEVVRVETEKHLNTLSRSVSRLGRKTQAKVQLKLQSLGLSIT